MPSRVPSSPESEPELPDTALVSAIAAHELNNVALTMQGFIDLATEGDPLSDPVQRCFQELRIGVERITALAAELDSLANPRGVSQRIAIGTLLHELMHDPQWHCDPTQIVVVDVYHARAAIRAMRRLARKQRPSASTAHLGVSHEVATVSRELAVTAACLGCGGSWSPSVPHVRVQVDARISRPDTRHPDHSARSLTLAVLLHSAHAAGGHVEIDENSQLLKLTLPAD